MAEHQTGCFRHVKATGRDVPVQSFPCRAAKALALVCLLMLGTMAAAVDRNADIERGIAASLSGDTNLLVACLSNGIDIRAPFHSNRSLLDWAIQNRHPRTSIRWLLEKGVPFNPEQLWAYGNREAWREVLAAGKMPLKTGELSPNDVSIHHIPPKTTCIVQDIKATAKEKWFLPERVAELKVIGIHQPGAVSRLYLPESISLLPDGFAESKTELSFLSMSDRVLELPERAFSGCVKLKRFVFPMSLTNIGLAAFKNSGMSEVDLSTCSNLRSIGAGAFEGNPDLQKVFFPSSLGSIGERAFASSSPQLTTVILGENIQAIGRGAFINCAGLRSIVIRAAKPPVLGGNIRGIIPPGTVVKVKKPWVEVFLKTKGWDGVEVLSE